jgi:hypothetical protein
MESTEPTQHRSGIFNYFQGATINNLVINGNMTKSGSEDYHNTGSKEATSTVTAEHVVEAVKRCNGIFSSMASYAIAFCVCRDLYHLEDNMASFERGLRQNGIEITEGSIDTAVRRSPYMKYHVDKWEENGADERTLKRRDVFRERMEEVLAL